MIARRAPEEKPEGPHDAVYGGYISDNPGDLISATREEEAWVCAEIARLALAQGIEAGTATTGTGVVHESPVLEEDAPND
jgi:hypothetical protein